MVNSSSELEADVEQPLFSIMMPAYNAEAYIALAIESIIAQTFSNFEVIIIDDCSTDGTYETAKKYADNDRRFKLLRNEENMGSCRTRACALKEMTGKFVAFLDSDDIWDCGKLEIFAERLATLGDSPLCLHSDALIIDAEGNETGESFQQHFNKDHKPLEGDLFEHIILTNWINLSSAVVDRKTLLEAGGFRMLENMVADDWDMWVRFARFAKFYYIPQKLTQYRMHGGGISAPHQVRRVAIARDQIFENIIKLYGYELPRRLRSRVCYLWAANSVVLGFVWTARKYFFEAWVDDKLNFKALLRVIMGK